MPRRTRREEELEIGPEGEIADAAAIEGAATAKEKLLPWLEGITSKNVESEEAKFTIAVCQLYADQEKLLEGGKFDYEPGADDLEEVLDDLLDLAEDDASNYPGTTRYSCKIVVNGVLRKMNFRLVNLEDGVKEGAARRLSDELRTGRSLEAAFGQQLRHNESFADKILHQSNATDDRKDRYIARLEKRIEMLEARELDAVPLLATVHDMSWKKEHVIREAEAEAEQKRQTMGMLTTLLPHFASHVLGPAGGQQLASGMQAFGLGGPPPGPGPGPGPSVPPGGVVSGAVVQPPEYPALLRVALHVEGLFAALEASPDKLQALQQTLDPMQLIAIAEIHAAIGELRAIRGDGRPARPSPPTPAAAPQSPNAHAGFVPFGTEP